MRFSVSLFAARHRRVLAAASAGLALTGAILLIRPPSPPTVDVLVAARDLTALSPVSTGDVVVRTRPADTVPDGALRPDTDPVGRSLTSPVLRGEILTRARIADPPADAYGADMVAAPIRISDSQAVALLHPGSRVDILAAAGDQLSADFGGAPAPPAETVVEDRPVIAVPGRSAESGLSAESGALIVVAVTGEEARALAGHAVADHLSFTITD
ncbi:MAG: RcpC/CpaB family pilus assembly protein [Nocardiopsaceae bacterium]|nr:RcpC/CpaB family pilus assembly protein [Nocardiopsaceae bacterium]